MTYGEYHEESALVDAPKPRRNLCVCCGEPATIFDDTQDGRRNLCAFCADPAHVHYGDSREALALKPHFVKGKPCGFYVYLTREQIARALGVRDADIPADLKTTRTVLDAGTGQILLRLKRQT